MRYAMLICMDPEATEADGAAAPPIDGWFDYAIARGEYIQGVRLQPKEDATTVRVVPPDADVPARTARGGGGQIPERPDHGAARALLRHVGPTGIGTGWRPRSRVMRSAGGGCES